MEPDWKPHAVEIIEQAMIRFGRQCGKDEMVNAVYRLLLEVAADAEASKRMASY